MHAPEKVVIITRQVMPATALPLRKSREPPAPDARGCGLVQAEGLGTPPMFIKGRRKFRKHRATILPVKPGVAMFLKKAPPADVMPTGSAWKPAYDAGHEPSKTTTTPALRNRAARRRIS
jgi:hypothetical protein